MQRECSVLTTASSASPEDIVPRVIKWLQTNDGWLLVFDNADDYSLGNSSERFRLQNKYFPKTGRGVILMTTRNDSAGQNGSAIKLDEMRLDDDTALKLLLRQPVTVANADPVSLEIIRELGYLPLAIDLAAACMEIENLTPSEFLESYKKDPALLGPRGRRLPKKRLATHMKRRS